MQQISLMRLLALPLFFFLLISPISAISSTARMKLTSKNCGPGTFFVRGICKDCPVGTFQQFPGSTSCAKCPPGTYGVVTGAQGVDVCALCPASTFSAASGAKSPSTCKPCPKRSNSYEGSGFCTSCRQGFVITFGRRNKCESCGFGSFTAGPGANECLDCFGGESNQRLNRKTNRCEDCPVGTEGGGVTCRPCNGREGFFSDGTQNSCDFCPVGFEGFPAKRARTCVPCPAGTAADNGSRDSFQACKKCARGENSNVTGARICIPDDTPCPKNYFRSDGGSCKRCDPLQRYSPKEKMCKPCKKNFGSNGGLDTRCRRCQKFAVSNPFERRCACREGAVPNADGSCRLCPAGTSTEVQTALCTPCRPGSFAANKGSGSCERCPSGMVARNPGATKCVGCSKGLLARTYRRFTGLPFNADFDFSECVSPKSLCPPGHKRVNDVDGLRVGCNPPSCPKGTFKVVAPAARRDCGFFCPTEQVEFCEFCPKTHRYDPKLNTCIVCQANEVTNGGLDTECRRCGKTEVEVNGECACRSLFFERSNERRGMSWIGFFTSRGIMNGRCQACPAGTIGTEWLGVCTPCPPGTFQDEKGEYFCKSCPPGTFSSSKGATKCDPCPRGTISIVDDVGSSNCVRPGSLK